MYSIPRKTDTAENWIYHTETTFSIKLARLHTNETTINQLNPPKPGRKTLKDESTLT